MDDASRPSYSNGPSDQPLLGQTIGANLDATAAAFGDREALVDVPSGQRWTYARLNADADALASGLIAAGIQPATGWASGRRTARSGSCCSTPPRRWARSWSTSTRPTAATSWPSRAASPA